MRILKVLFVLVLVVTPVVASTGSRDPVVLPDSLGYEEVQSLYDSQKAMAYAWEKAWLWKTIQGEPNTNSRQQYADQLEILINEGVAAEDLVHTLAQRWEEEYGPDRLLAARWCIYQQVRFPVSCPEHLAWAWRVSNLMHDYLRYQDCVSGVGFEEMLAWAYLWRHFKETQPYVAEAWREEWYRNSLFEYEGELVDGPSTIILRDFK